MIRRLRLFVVLCLLWPLSASAANLVWLETGTDATQDLSFYSSTTGTVASATDQKHTGPRSIKLSTGSPAAAANVQRTGVLADAGRRISVSWRSDTVPAGGSGGSIIGIHTSGGTAIMVVAQTTTSHFQVGFTGTATTGTLTIQPNTWYRLSVAYTITNTTTYAITLYVDGTQDATQSNTGTLPATASNAVRLNLAANVGVNANVWFDDLVVDDGTSGEIGGGTADALRVTNKRPNANGSANTFDTSTGTGSGYGTGNSVLVNEQPLSTASRRSMAANTGSKIEAFAIENISTGDVNFTGATQVGYLSWIHGSGITTDTIYTNNAAAVPDGPATITSAQIYWRVTTSASYPTGDQAGMGRPTGNATDAVFNEGGVLFAYTPAAAGTAPNRLMLLGVK